MHELEFTDSATIQLLRKIAAGGMGVVYEGRKTGADGFTKQVAVKMLRGQHSQTELFQDLLIAEAKLVANLVHENIVQIHQLGKLENGTHYLVMEFVQGISLRQFLRKHSEGDYVFPSWLAVHIASRVARGLSYAHGFTDETGEGLHIVHRDVCPSNIMITLEGLTKLTDFGIAKAVNTALVGDDWRTGKIPYKSPEQAARKPLDFRTDLYSLGAVLFEMLADETVRPDDADPDELNFAEYPVPWDALPDDLPEDLFEIVSRLLIPDPSLRYASAAEVAKALEYHIYKDGYGPTIQTVEEYMRSLCPDLYEKRPPFTPDSGVHLTKTTMGHELTECPDE